MHIKKGGDITKKQAGRYYKKNPKRDIKKTLGETIKK